MYHYRLARPDDLPAICTLTDELQRIHHAAAPQVFTDAGQVKNLEDICRNWVSNPDHFCLVADAEGTVAGFAVADTFTETHPFAHALKVVRLMSICVAAPYRRQGLGRGLLAELEKHAHEVGAHEIRMIVWDFNQGAKALYQDAGFKSRSTTLSKTLSTVRC